MIRTFETRIDVRSDAELHSINTVLEQYSNLMNYTQRLIHAKLQSGRVWTGDIHKTLYKELGITSIHINIMHRQLLAKLASIKELAKDRVKDLNAKIKSKEAEISKRNKTLVKHQKLLSKASKDQQFWKERCDKCKQDNALKLLKRSLREYHAYTKTVSNYRVKIQTIKDAIHQNKRRLNVLNHKLSIAQQQMLNPSLCFGTKKLFKAQHYINENGFENHAGWKKKWRYKRNSSFKFDGNAKMASGNDFAKLTTNNNVFDLELRLPEALRHLANEHARNDKIHIVRISDLSFNHGNDIIRQTLENKQPVTVAFLKDEKSWKIIVTVDHKLEWIEPDFKLGAIGLDLNADHIAVAQIDRFGNPKKTWTIPLVTYGKTSDQVKDLIRKAVKDIVLKAKQLDVPIVSEKLDFSQKKRDIKQEDGAKYARVLSSFSYSLFDAALTSACARYRVAHKRVNPAYTSLIGRVKFTRRYGLSVHTAAALSIARRAMGLSERVPTSSGKVIIPLNSSEHVTLALPVRMKHKHVWSEWSLVYKEMKKVHEEQRLSMRDTRRPSLRRCGGVNEYHGLSGKTSSVMKLSSLAVRSRADQAPGGNACNNNPSTSDVG